MTPTLVLLAAGLFAAADDKPVTLRVLCYNIHHGEGTDGKIDLPRLAKVITAAKPDLVALQEVDHKTRRTGGVDQTAELARLTGLAGKFGKAIDYEGGGYGQAVLSRFPIDELKVHLLPGTPDRERRIAAEARVTVGGRDLSFVTTHLHHQNAAFREQQAAELNALFGTADRPVILAGDLNADPDSKPLGILLGKWANATSGPALFTFPAGKPAKQIDYVLYRPAGRFRAVEAKVIAEAVASDHRPVLAVLELVP
jgi:endonuclease/exonuclease/phosphatase family metal-dependent hydrolase